MFTFKPFRFLKPEMPEGFYLPGLILLTSIDLKIRPTEHLEFASSDDYSNSRTSPTARFMLALSHVIADRRRTRS
jgi:hypothetical protein